MEKKNKLIKSLQQHSQATKDPTTTLGIEKEILSKIQLAEFYEDYYEKFNKNDQKIFWDCYHKLLTSLLEKIEDNNDNDSNTSRQSSSRSNVEEKVDGDGNEPTLNQKKKNEVECCLKIFQLTQFVSRLILQTTNRNANMDPILMTLHDLLIPFPDSIPKSKELKLLISRICEKLWLGKEENSERYIPQLIPYLLLIALEPDSFDSDIKRIYGIKDAFNEFDYEDPTIETIRGLLLRCFVDVKFLKVHSPPPLTPSVTDLGNDNNHRLLKEEDFFLMSSLCMRVRPSLSPYTSLPYSPRSPSSHHRSHETSTSNWCPIRVDSLWRYLISRIS
jgi:hypothetical protein